MTLFITTDFPETLPQRRRLGPEWKKNAKKWGSKVKSKNFEQWAVENFFSALSISKTEQFFAKFSGIAGLTGPSLRFGPKVGGVSNFQGSGGVKLRKMAIRMAGGLLWLGP